MKELLLIGGGHSHVEVIRQFSMHPVAGVRITLVSPTTHTPYSGMLPGLIAGHYSYRQCHIDLPALALTANCRFIPAAINGLHADARIAFCDNGETLAYDVASIDIGSTPATLGIAGATRHGTKAHCRTDSESSWPEVARPGLKCCYRCGIACLAADFRRDSTQW
jgi:selenide,water dikinase